MTMKRWDHPPGTCRAVIAVHGRQLVVCHACKRCTGLPPLDVPFEPCPFVCRHCGRRGSIEDPAGVPKDYLHDVWSADARAFVAPKNRWKPTR